MIIFIVGAVYYSLLAEPLKGTSGAFRILAEICTLPAIRVEARFRKGIKRGCFGFGASLASSSGSVRQRCLWLSRYGHRDAPVGERFTRGSEKWARNCFVDFRFDLGFTKGRFLDGRGAREGQCSCGTVIIILSNLRQLYLHLPRYLTAALGM